MARQEDLNSLNINEEDENAEVELRSTSPDKSSKANNTRSGRTPTTVVSEVFAFLNHNLSTDFETLDDEAIDELEHEIESTNGLSSKKIPVCYKSGATLSSVVIQSTEVPREGNSQCFSGVQSKDSGFASLERQPYHSDDAYASFIRGQQSNSVGGEDELYLEPANQFESALFSNAECEQGDRESNVYDDVAPAESDIHIEDRGDVFCQKVQRERSEAALGTIPSQDSNQNLGHNSFLPTYEVHQFPPSKEGAAAPQSSHATDSIKIFYEASKKNQIYSDKNVTDVSDSISNELQSHFNPSSNSDRADNVFTINLDLVNRQQYDGPKVSVSSLDQDSYVNMYTSLDVSSTNEAFTKQIDQDAHHLSSEDECEDGTSESQVVQSVQEDGAVQDEMYDTVSVDQGAHTEDKHQTSMPVMKGTMRAAKEPSECSSGDKRQDAEHPNCTTGSPHSLQQTQSSAAAQDQSQDNAAVVSPEAVLRRCQKLETNPSAEEGSGDSSDEDVGIYAESFRRSNWIRMSQEGKLELTMNSAVHRSSSTSTSSKSSLPSYPGESVSEQGGEEGLTLTPKADEVFTDPMSVAAARAKQFHKRSDSTTTTLSELEFKRKYVSRRKCLIQRADSQQEYHRLSSRVYDQDKMVVVERASACDDLGLHLLDSHPAFITSVDPGSAADKAGIVEGQILVSVNDHVVLTTDHKDIVELIQESTGSIRLGVANSDFQPVRDLQAVVMSGFLYKQGNSSLMKMWKKRYFVLRQDNCLYYYKNENENDPLGALPLNGYTISRHTDTSKDYCFKAEKYGARTYYFMTDSRDQLSEWVGALTEAAARSKKRKESFLSVSSHNVGLPALDIRRPECSGFLGKLSPSRRSWRRRYCVLKDACIYYYKDMSSLSALGVAHLHGYKVDAENHPRKKSSFSLQPPEVKMRVFYFSAENETDKKRWVEALIHSIQRWVKVDKEAEC